MPVERTCLRAFARTRTSLRFCAATVALCFLAAAEAQARLKEGDAFPPLKTDKLGGGEIDFASFAGKVVVVDLWASWCEPCKAEIPALDDLYKKYRAKGLVVVGVSVDEKESDAQAFLQAHPAGFPIAFDGTRKAAMRAIEPRTMPTSVIVGRDGKIVRIHGGFRPDDRKKFESEAVELLK